METLEKSRMCRLCGKHSGIAIDIFDKTENHMRKINAILPILVHEMDLLPKQMCHRCSYKLEEFYNFYVDCAKTDTELKNQLSWMRKENLEEKIITPMVKMNKFKIKTELPDNDDAIDPNNVLGHISENSLLFPSSILQHSFDPSTGPMLPCSHCRCMCSRSIKINKNSHKQVTVATNLESESQICSSNVISNISDKVNELNKSKSVDKKFTFNKDMFEHSNLKEKNIKQIFTITHDNSEHNSNNIHNDSNLKSEKLNRALRPRKDSVNYMGQKKKGMPSNLKTKFKNKLDIFDSSLINCVDFKLSQSNSIHPSPIIKLQKVDDTIRTLRTRTNLEEFNRRIKEFKHKQCWQREKIQNKKILHRTENYNRKLLQQEVNQRKKNVHRKENQNSKQARETSNKKNLQIEKNDGNEQYLNSETNKANEDVIRLIELKVKEEVVNKTSENESSEQLEQEKSFELDYFKGQKIFKAIDRYPLCAVVKLEKDYTCNVDYPRIKIKRHLAVANSSKSKYNLEVPVEQTNIFELPVNGKSFTKKKSNISPKNLRSKERERKFSNIKDKSVKVLRKNNRKLDLVNVKRILLEKTSSVVSQTDLKRYCEECDTCFRNKELYKLHPCYQK